ncbi:hypothetical protein GCM10027436_54170 [Actinophytocola sediminis]
MFIATAEYPNDPLLPDLPEVADGARALRETLTSQDIGGFRARHCALITNPGDPAEVVDRLRELIADAEDTALIYYAGHGLLGLPAKSEREPLLLGLTGSTRDRPYRNSLPVDWVFAELRSCPARNRLLVVDCCYSGRALPGVPMGDPATLAANALDAQDVDGGWILASGKADMASHILAGARFPGLTGALLAVMAEGVPYRPDVLTLQDLYVGARRRMRQQHLPPPQVWGENSAAQLALVRNAAYSPDLPDTDEYVLGAWWTGVVIRRGGEDAGRVRGWLTRRRQEGGLAGAYANRYGWESVFFTPSALRWQKGIRFDPRTDALRALDPGYAVIIVATATRTMEPNVAKVIRMLIADDPDQARMLLRGLLAEYPLKAVRLCREATLAAPPPEWFHDQHVELPGHPGPTA